MKKLFTIVLILISTNVWASAPTRGVTYSPGTTISSTDVNANENALYNYLIAGVDTYAAGSIIDGAISTSANIQSSKLSLSSIAQNITNTGTFANIGAVTITGALSASGGINSTAVGAITPSTGAFTTLSATTSTTLTGTLNVGVTNQGDIFYDNGTNVVRLVPGSSGQFLKTQGASANPVWAANQFVPNNIQIFTATGTWTRPAGINTVYVKVWGGGGGGSDAAGGGNGAGGGGGYSEGSIAVTGNVTVTIGSAGSGGNPATDGTSSTFAGTTTITAGGGVHGNGGTGGAGGTSSNGSINLTGQTGGNGATSIGGLAAGPLMVSGSNVSSTDYAQVYYGQGGKCSASNNGGMPGLVIVYY